MITIKEMAEMIGVSTTTISNVIHGKTGEVSQSTVDKVQKMLEECDYIPNISARNLAQNKSKIIGIAMRTRSDKYENLLADPFFGELLGAVEKTVRANGYFMMMYISDDINEIIHYVSTWNIDGLLLVGMVSDEFIRIRSRYKKPFVLIDSYYPKDFKNYVNVGLEDSEGMYMMTNYLFSMGHKKIGIVTDNLEGVDYYRYQGYERAMQEHGFTDADENIILFRPAEEEREESLREIYNLRDKYTVFACMSDYYAVLLMDYMMDQGISIPDDISITGFDNNMVGKMMRPRLTTIRQDVEEKGKRAAEALLGMLQDKEVEHDIRLPVELVIQDSVKKLKD